MLIAHTTQNLELSVPKSALMLSVLLTATLYSAKLDYDSRGIRWENAEYYVNAGHVTPVEVDVADWAWIPYFYHEESFQKRLTEAGGDKFKIGQIHTWWDYPEYKYTDQKLGFSNNSCENTPEDADIKQDITTRNIFKKYNLCLLLNLKNEI